MSSNQKVIFTLTEEDLSYKRLDKLLAIKFPKLSRSLIKKNFEAGRITSLEHKLFLNKLPPLNTEIHFLLPPEKDKTIYAENIPLHILYEDEHLIFINKEAGMVVHPAPGNETGTLVNALIHHYPPIRNVGEEKRPGIVHRLDKGTSGVMVIAKSSQAYEALIQIFSTHDITREYHALVIGNNFQAYGVINASIGRNPNDRKKMKANVDNGKQAITHYFLQKEYKNYSHLKLVLETGRTHQIRVHLSHLLKSPVLGDQTYANVSSQRRRLPKRQSQLLAQYPYPILHAKVLAFKHPITHKELYFEADFPNIFKNMITN